MKNVITTALVATLGLTSPLLAEDTKFSVSGSAALTTNYIWRGISYTDETATGQAGIDFSNVANVEGLHMNLWGSGIQEGSEIDYILGYSGEVSKVGYDVGYILYYYTQDYVAGTFAGATYGEAFVSLSYEDYGFAIYKEIGMGGSADYDGLTFIASGSFGPVDVALGSRISPTADEPMNFGSVGVNWPCTMDKTFNMNATVAYNSGFEASQALFGADGVTFALTLSKGF